MKRVIQCISLFLFVAVQLMAQSDTEIPVCPLGNEWKWVPAFSDEFDGTTLNNEKWWDFNPAWVGRKPAYFDRNNVAVKNGHLELSAKSLDPSEVSVENKARGLDKFSTAIVKSKRRILSGYFEARSRSMRSGVCNAFWLYDPLDADKKYREGDASEEIDIFELFGKLPDPQLQRTFWATIHRYETPYVESVVNKKKTKLPNYSFKQLSMGKKFFNESTIISTDRYILFLMQKLWKTGWDFPTWQISPLFFQLIMSGFGS
jgi:hypothetical protein